MSWGITHPCWNCEHNITGINPEDSERKCTDMKKIETAIFEIHQDCNHKGAGTIAIVCGKCKAKT